MLLKQAEKLESFDIRYHYCHMGMDAVRVHTSSSPWPGVAHLLLRCTPQLEKHTCDSAAHTRVQGLAASSLCPAAASLSAPAAALTSRKLSFPSKSSSTSLIMFFSPRWVCGAPSFSIISFSSIRSMYPSRPESYLRGAKGEGQPSSSPISIFPEEEP